MPTQLTVFQGDITTLRVHAIVNAANSSLLGGGGVDGAIHRVAGKELLAECLTLNGCPTGEAKLTKGYKLYAGFVIHTVGPVWQGGDNNEDQLLYNAYHNSLQLASVHGITTIAFPAISTGVYHFPRQRAAGIALNAVQKFCATNPDSLTEVIFACFDDENYRIYQTLINTT